MLPVALLAEHIFMYFEPAPCYRAPGLNRRRMFPMPDLESLIDHLRIPERRRGKQQCVDAVQHATVPR